MTSLLIQIVSALFKEIFPSVKSLCNLLGFVEMSIPLQLPGTMCNGKPQRYCPVY